MIQYLREVPAKERKEWEIQQRKKALNDKYNGIIEKIDRGYQQEIIDTITKKIATK